MRIRTRSIALAVCVLAALGSLPAPASAVPAAPTPVVSGNHIVDSRSGATWVPHGVNWPSFEYACIQGWGYSADGATSAAAAAMAQWHVNTVRVPLNEDCWLGTMSWSGGRSTAGYRAAVADWVQVLNAAGLVVILDLHWTSPTAGQSSGQRAMADARSLTLWSSVAGQFAGNPSVIFDLFNEPYSRWNDATNSWAFEQTWACWRDGGCSAPTVDDATALTSGRYTTVGMAALVAAVRAAGAAQPIMLGGLDYANDLSGWWANRPNDSQLIASWHAYQTQACQATCRETVIAPLADKVPVLIGEFGQTDGGHGYVDGLMAWADVHGMGYAPWAWWVVDATESLSASRYALISNLTTFAPKAPVGTSYHDHLASLPPTGSPDAPAGSFTLRQSAKATIEVRGWALNL